QTTTLLIVSLLETPTNQLLLRRPFPQLRQDHTLQLFSEIRTNDPTLKRRIPPLIRSQPLRQTLQIDRLDQIVTDPRRRLPRPVPTKKHLQRFPTRMELNLLHMRHIPQQRIRAHLPFDRRQDLRDAHTLPRRQPIQHRRIEMHSTRRIEIFPPPIQIDLRHTNPSHRQTQPKTRDSAHTPRGHRLSGRSAPPALQKPRGNPNLYTAPSYGSAHSLSAAHPLSMSRQTSCDASSRGNGSHRGARPAAWLGGFVTAR